MSIIDYFGYKSCTILEGPLLKLSLKEMIGGETTWQRNAFTIVIGGILIAPEFIALVSTGEPITFFGLPVVALGYGATFVPILLTIPLMMQVERLLSKIPLGIFQPIVVPAFTILITAPIALIILAPLANTISSGLAYVVNFLYYHTSIFGGLIIGATSPFIVLTGLHTAISFPILMNEIITTGGSTYFAILNYGEYFSWWGGIRCWCNWCNWNHGASAIWYTASCKTSFDSQWHCRSLCHHIWNLIKWTRHGWLWRIAYLFWPQIWYFHDHCNWRHDTPCGTCVCYRF